LNPKPHDDYKITPSLTTNRSMLSRHIIEERMNKQLRLKHLLYLMY